MSVIRRFVILEDSQKSLETTIKFLLDEKTYSWDKIYLFSAFVSHPAGVEEVKKILRHPSLNENTEVVIAIGTKYHFNNPSDLQDLLNFIDKKEESNIKTKFVRFICPTNDDFHIKAYCFLGRHVIDNKEIEIGFSIIGSSNLTRPGLKCEGELCISIHNLNLTKELIKCLSNKYGKSPPWKQGIKEYKRQYNEEHSRKDQNEDPQPLVKAESKDVQDPAPITSTPPKGKFLKLGVINDNDIALIDKATNLVNGRENIDWFHSSHTTIEQAKVDFPEHSLWLLLTENKIFKIGEIISHRSDKEKTEGCFVIYRKNVTYELSDDLIVEILLENKEEYEKIKIAEEKYEECIERNEYPELEYATLKYIEEKVKKYQEMLVDDKYKKGLEKAKKMQSQIDILLKEIEETEEIDPILLKEKLKKIREAI